METKKLNILHIAVVTGNKSSGISNVVPKHLQYQSKYANVALLNCYEKPYEEKNDVNYPIFKLDKKFDLDSLEKPYNNPDLVVFHAIYWPAFLSIYKKLIKKNIPYIIVPHCSLTVEAQKQNAIKKKIGNVLFFNNFIKNAKAIQYLCEGEKNRSMQINNKYIIAGNGIEISNEKKLYNNKNDKQFKVIYIGRYSIQHKGLDLLVKSAQSIKKEMLQNNIKLVLYGADFNGDQKKLEKLIIDTGTKDVIDFNGPIYGKEKQNVLLNSDIFIQTSRLEGQPLGVMEAISLGLPCILTPGTNLGEDVENGKCGWLVEGNEEAIGKAIIKAYNCKEQLSLYSQKAIEFANKNFEWDVVAQKAVTQYEGLV